MRMIDRAWLRGQIRRSDRHVFGACAVAPEVDERVHGGDLVTGYDGYAVLTIARRPRRRPREFRGRDRPRMDTHESVSFSLSLGYRQEDG
jgi:hypothetical protein